MVIHKIKRQYTNMKNRTFLILVLLFLLLVLYFVLVILHTVLLFLRLFVLSFFCSLQRVASCLLVTIVHVQHSLMGCCYGKLNLSAHKFMRTYISPHYGAKATENCHFMLFPARKSQTTLLVFIVFKYLDTQENVWVLSDISLEHPPLAFRNRRRASKKVGVDKSLTSSKWTALV